MVNVSAVALSGLYASEKRIAVAADNVANVDSSNYKAKDVALSSNAGGVDARVVERAPATITVSDTNGGTLERPNVSTDEEVVQAQIATYSAQANLKVIKAADKMNHYLLDIQA